MSTLSLFFILVLTRFRALHPHSGHVFETGIDGHTSASRLGHETRCCMLSSKTLIVSGTIWEIRITLLTVL